MAIKTESVQSIGNPTKKKKNLLFYFILIFSLGVLLILGYVFFGADLFEKYIVSEKNDQNIENIENGDSQENVFVQQMPEEPQYMENSEIDVLVLNGSMVPGVAGNASVSISTYGFEKIEVDNANEVSSETVIRFTRDISPNSLALIIAYAEDTFSSVSVEEVATAFDGKYQIVITTGTLK